MKKLRGGDNGGRGEYPVTTTSALGLLIRIKGGIWRNQKSSTNENSRGRGGTQHKERMGHTFTPHKLGTEDNATLVPGKYGTTLNATCYNCLKLCHIVYNCPELGRTGTQSLKFIRSFTQKQI